MRIAALVYLAPRKIGSLEQWVLELAAECVRRGHAVKLFCGEPVHGVVASRLAELGVTWSPYRLLEQHPVQWGRQLRGSFDLIYMNLVVPQSRLAYAAYLAAPLPICFFDGISGPMPGQRGATWIRRTLDPWIFSRVTRLGACSQYVLQRDINRFKLDPRRCRVLYNAIDPERFAPRPSERSSPITIAAVANLIPEKGLDVLLRACATLTDLPWQLTIVGDGPERARLESLAGSLALTERTRFAGLRDDVEVTLQRAALYVHPCLWEEAFGLTITEAMACGCAVVASRRGGIPEIIEHGTSGILVEAGNVAELSRVLRELLNDPTRRAELGAAARARVQERFSLIPAVRQQVDWIEETYASRGRVES